MKHLKRVLLATIAVVFIFMMFCSSSMVYATSAKDKSDVPHKSHQTKVVNNHEGLNIDLRNKSSPVGQNIRYYTADPFNASMHMQYGRRRVTGFHSSCLNDFTMNDVIVGGKAVSQYVMTNDTWVVD